MRQVLLLLACFLLAFTVVHIAEGQWAEGQAPTEAGPWVLVDDDDSAKGDDDDSAAPFAKPPPPAQVIVQQVEQLQESAAALDVLNAYLTDKEAVEKGTCPEDFELQPLGTYKEKRIKEPLTKRASSPPKSPESSEEP